MNGVYTSFSFYNTKISDNNAESGKVPECLQRFHVEWQGKSSRKGISLLFESPDSAIRRFPMTLMKSMASLHRGPKVSKAKLLNMQFD
jgi:hypothetical protein